MERIGKYEILRQLGCGATSAVYLAYDPFARREVAIKRIHPETLQDPRRGRIHRQLVSNEAALAGKLSHPHIVHVYDAAVDPEDTYIVMEYAPGGTLEQHCSPDNLLPYERLVELMFKCTRALDYAFQQGITHRDIKPANILLAGPSAALGDVKISDFGAALNSANEATQISGVGSPAYMSPQQVRELPLDHRTDIYSLGVVMYELLCGRLPYQASNNYSLIYQIMAVEPPPPSAHRPDVPAALDAIVARAMEKNLEARYRTWNEFAQDLMHAFRNQQLRQARRDLADSEKFETLRELAFFREFSDVELWEVLRFSDWSQVAPATVVMRDGERGDYFGFITEGELRVSKGGRTLSTLTRGDCFGEMAVVSHPGGSRGADVVALTDAKIITIRASALKRASEVCRMHFYHSFLQVLAARLTAANRQLAAL